MYNKAGFLLGSSELLPTRQNLLNTSKVLGSSFRVSWALVPCSFLIPGILLLVVNLLALRVLLCMDGDKHTSAIEDQTTLQFAAVQSVYSGACLLSFYTNLLFLEQTVSSMFPVFF